MEGKVEKMVLYSDVIDSVGRGKGWTDSDMRYLVKKLNCGYCLFRTSVCKGPVTLPDGGAAAACWKIKPG